MLLMAFLITGHHDPLSEVVPEDKDMHAPDFCQESSLTMQCNGSTHMKKLYLLLRPELFPSRLLQQHDAELQGKEEPIFGLYSQVLILERSAHNKQGNWENQFVAL